MIAASRPVTGFDFSGISYVVPFLARQWHVSPPDSSFTLGQRKAGDGRFSPALLFAGSLLVMTPILWLFYIFNSMAVFFNTSWMPVLIEQVGLTPAHAALTTALYMVGGILGGLLAGWLIDRLGMFVIAAMPIIGAVASGLRGHASSEVMVIATAFAAGFFVVGTQNAIMTVAPIIYPTAYRAKGEGTAIAVAKIGAIAGPVIGGILLTAHLPVQDLFYAAAVAVLLGGLVGSIYAALYRRHVTGAHSQAE
jgi:AAHS family 4-hydroxybenzoate transporter-like MFS transporter